MMAKYEPLSRYLKSNSKPSLTLSFAEIEAIIGAKLPRDARERKGWWWSDPVSGSPQVQCRAWVQNGYVTAAIDLDAGQVTFQTGRPVSKHHHSATRVETTTVLGTRASR
jgi:hypothetical protein